MRKGKRENPQTNQMRMNLKEIKHNGNKALEYLPMYT